MDRKLLSGNIRVRGLWLTNLTESLMKTSHGDKILRVEKRKLDQISRVGGFY